MTRPMLLVASVWAVVWLAVLSGEANGKDVRRLRAPGSLELDWSYAGRSAGSNSAPYIRSLTVQATSYGVRADGYSDDSDAIQRAIEDVEYRGGGTVILPSGRIRLERQIRITASNTILRGAGMDKTTFDIPNSLRHYGKRKGKDNGFIEIRGPALRTISGSTYLAEVISDSAAGFRSLAVSDTRDIFPGDWVRIIIDDQKYAPVRSSLLGYMYNNPNQKESCGQNCLQRIRGMKNVVRFMSRVSDVRYGEIVLERELPFDIESSWRPEIHSVPSDLVPQNCGLQDFTVEFRNKRSKKHLDEDGFNAIFVGGSAFSWVKNIAVVNADVNFLVLYSNFVSISGVETRFTKDRSHPSSKGKQGHIAIGIHDSCDVDVSNFDIQGKWWHDLSTRASMLSVFRSGKGYDLSLDLHKTAPYMILYSNIFLGNGTKAFTTGGKSGSGMPTAAYTTFWNIRDKRYKPIRMPGCDYGPKLNFIGNFEGETCPGYYVDKEEKVEPADLFTAQKRRRT